VTVPGGRTSTSIPLADGPRITVSKDGPYLVRGGVPLVTMTIRTDGEGHCREWVERETYPVQEQYALCRCGRSRTKPFCDGTHTAVRFNGTETASKEPYFNRAEEIEGPSLRLTDTPDLCVHARFCLRAGGIWDLISQSDDLKVRRTVIEIAGNCPAGRLVVWDKTTGEAIEPAFEPSIGVIEYPEQGRIGPLWVRGGIPIESADGTLYEIRHRVTLCRCGRSSNKPFCDGSHREV